MAIARCTSVTVVANGLEVLEVLKSHTYDLILMDGSMPRMDGLEATRQIRQQGMDVPIIGVTAHAMASDRAHFLEAGMDGYITKPIKKENLYKEIMRHLRHESS